MDDFHLEGLAPLKQEAAPLRNKIIKALRRAIEIGTLQPGARLVEKDLCNQLGVSRTSLREALRQLQAEGALTDLNNRGLTVTGISNADATNIYSIRKVLEPLIVGQFVDNASEAEVAALKGQGARLMAAYKAGSAEDIVSAKRDFYDAICTGAKNPIGFELLNKLTLLTSPLRRKSVVRPERRVESIAEIQDLIEAIARGDRDAAQGAISRHVANATVSALKVM